MKTLFCIFLSLTVTLIFAQDSFVIKNVQLFDGEKELDNRSILVENGKIVKIAKKIKGDHPEIDGTGKFLMPAMTNSHVHVWMPQLLKQAAQAGVLNLLDMHGMEPMQPAMKVYRDSTNYANFYAAGYAATAPNGHGTQYGFPVPTLEKPADAKKWVDDREAAGVDHIKLIIEPWKNTISHETAKAVIDAAHKKDKVVVAHISKEADAYQVITNNVDGLVHIWGDKTMNDTRMAELAQQKNFFVIPSVLVERQAHEFYLKKSAKESDMHADFCLKEIKRLYDAKIPLLIGTDAPNAGINMGTDIYKELKYFSDAGIPNLEVLKSATSIPATKFKLAKKGFIKEGYIADMILIDGNPLEEINDIANIITVWKAGKPIQR